MVAILAALVGMVTMATPTYGAPATTTPNGPVTGTSAGPKVRSSAPLSPPVVPAAGTAYLGAFVDPSGQALSGAAPLGGTGGVAAELASLPSFEHGLGRPLSIVEVDQSWSVPVGIAQLRRVAGTGAIPMITWECGDTDANVTAGVDDPLITRFAHELSSLGAPVMVRWFPDANGSSPATQACLGAGGAAGYVAAFQHVSQLLGSATNAATVWSVDTSQGSRSDWAGFYPGASSTDWIAADDESPTAAPGDPGGVSSAFGSWYSTFSTYGRPLLISNTGTTPGSQRQFFAALSSHLPTKYPLIKGRGLRRRPPSGGPEPAGSRLGRAGRVFGAVTHALLPAVPLAVLDDHQHHRCPHHQRPAGVHRRFGEGSRPRWVHHLSGQRVHTHRLRQPSGAGDHGL